MARGEPRQGMLAVAWTADGLIARITVDSEHWASVERLEKRQRWYAEDS
jgi:hypothetical protein